jgi:hypothetical protein
MALDSLDPLTAPMPAPPVRQFSFTDFQTNNPTAPPPGDRLDAEFDRANNAVTDTIAWANVTLNTDGTLRDGIVGESNLQPDLFDSVASDAIAQVQPLVDQAASYASAAGTSANAASNSATTASSQAVIAQGAAGAANTAQVNASASATTAQGAANAALSSQTGAANADNDAQGAAALAQDYAVVTQAWAEHMPDPIPPNILAVMGITGDHWSSRWWANQAAAAFGALTSLYLGAFPAPPTQTPTGQPIPIGAIYFNTTTNQPYVWTGTGWVPFYAPTKAVTLSLAYSANGSQTTFPLTTVDLAGNTYTMNATTPEPLDVFVNGVRLLLNQPAGVGDWNVNATTSTVTLVAAPRAGSVVQMDVLTPPSALAPSRVTSVGVQDFNLDPVTGAPGQINGSRTTFALVTPGARSQLTVNNAVELLVCIEGATQQPGTDYAISADKHSIIFTEAPLAGARAWATWFAPGGAVIPP